MTTYVPPLSQHYAVRFDKNVNIYERVDVQKQFKSLAIIKGNVGNASADAKAFGYDTLAETLTLTYAEQGYGSAAFSESTSATNGAYHYIGGW
jgi:hypothetical protein